MDDILIEILHALRAGVEVDTDFLETLMRKHNRNLSDNKQHYAKKQVIPYYLNVKENDPDHWKSWHIDPQLEQRLMQAVRVKPSRTASGVATITVLTKPWKCSSNCLYCPNDLMMPKSYLSDEPACQRAQRNCFDPFLQAAARIHTLTQMGHVTDRIELIILGGTWTDYPKNYQLWFVSELLRALTLFDDQDTFSAEVTRRRAFYDKVGFDGSRSQAQQFVEPWQSRVNNGACSYNHAWDNLYGKSALWESIAQMQTCSVDNLDRWQETNAQGTHRVVGIAIETRPDGITPAALQTLKRVGCTKVQIGIQSLNPQVLTMNDRRLDIPSIRTAFSLLRLYGFKVHAHFMVNLYGTNPTADKADYLKLVTNTSFIPDEIKLYPCVLVAGTKLNKHFADKSWQPYSENELLDVLVADTLHTPPYIRISRMIRDISAHDIKAGNKKVNLRQMVEQKLDAPNQSVNEMRYREIGARSVNADQISYEVLQYETDATNEYFIQAITKEHRIVAFLRLSLPHETYVRNYAGTLPVNTSEAMVRELHLYGRSPEPTEEARRAERFHIAQSLVAQAQDVAHSNGYTRLNVMCSIGMRSYYDALGFTGRGAYQYLDIDPK
ncbi:MAG: tRNA uridine(34) 5-carboxymethylaminomethyl modification radical SAM/GNAT enzyme Elp3 [Eggerthellaceae bacterium]|jgi:elongator complex protein 3|nr:tRNA uridine(34) 5-carboxymethylaminomethyl modification radical SAM/GNAT enzyme Elp3 [Eggerthellaceae bacterium]MCH4220659.1 tRNA uridine(34) 5-carboxymethylaminomethyl modification radical SAM/GNAT enzyme Elp3 [Eggerthellaceae bacterium]